MRAKFRYYLKSDATHYYYVSGSNVLQDTVAKPLPNAPIDWKETELQWKRNEKYHGVFRAFSIAVTFVTDAATILRSIYYSQGAEGRCTLYIEQKDNVSTATGTTEFYIPFYEGDIDFSRSNDSFHSFQAAVLDAGLSAILKAKSNVPVEIPILDSDSHKVFLDGILLRANAHYVVPDQGTASPIAMSNSMIISPAGSEGINGAQTFMTMPQLLPATLTLNQNKIYTCLFAETATVKAKFTAFVHWPSSASSNVFFTLIMLHGDASSGVWTTNFIYQTGIPLAPGQSATFPVNHQFTVSLAAGDSIAVFPALLNSSNVSLNSSSSVFKITVPGTIDVSSDFIQPPGICKSYRQIQVYEKLVASMVGAGYTVASTHLSTPSLMYQDAKPYNTLLTSGDAVRGLGDTAAPAKIVTTLDELHQDGSARDMVGIGVEGSTVRVERLEYFYDNNTIIADLGEVSDFTVSPATNYLVNTIKAGYVGQTNDNTDASLNGKDDFTTTITFSSDAIRVKSELDLISPFIASMYVLEYLRANLSGKKTTDTKNDNDTFLLEVEDGLSSVTLDAASAPIMAYKLARRQNDAGNSMAGLISSVKAFNAGLTSKRSLLRNGPRVAIPFHLQTGAIKFATVDKNAAVESNLGSGLIVERSDVQIPSLPDPLFLPILLEFKSPVPVDIPALIAANPYGRINFSARNRKGVLIELGGFIDTAGILPADNSVYNWKLLACPDTNLSDLIH